MANRVYYASQGVAVSGVTVEGAQSAGVSANFTLEQAFQLGKIGIYDNIITNAEANISVSKILDGNHTIYKLFTLGNVPTGESCVAHHAATTQTIRIASNTSDSATALVSGAQNCVELTGAYLNSISYTIPVDGFSTEEVSFVADNKKLNASASVLPPSGTGTRASYRQMVDIAGSNFPSEVNGQNVTNISFSTDYGREAMYKLGSFNPYFRYANFPIEVTVEFTVANTGVNLTPVDMGNITATSDGNLPGKQDISVRLTNAAGFTGSHGYEFRASGCRLTSVSQDGGDTGGGNASTTFSYTTYNDFCISG